MEGAACARSGADPEVFYTADRFSHPELDTKQIDKLNGHRKTVALAICAGCPVREQCLEDNLTDPYGIFGGMLPTHRRRLAAERGLTVEVEDDYDFAAVELAMNGGDPKLRKPDKIEIVRRMTREGATWDAIVATARVNSQGLSAIRRVA